MAKFKKELTVEKHAEICILRKEGYSLRQIAKKVTVSCGGTVITLERKKETGICSSRKRSRRLRTTTIQEVHVSITTSKRNRFLTAPAIAPKINENRINSISVSTIKNRLNVAELRGCVAKQKPLLCEINRQKRL